MDSEVQKWLKERYRSAPSDGPQAKKMKFGDVHQDLSDHFTTSFNAKMVSQEIKTAFPNTHSKAVGSGRIKHVFGIEQITNLPSTSGHVERLERKVQQLEERLRELEQPSQLSRELNTLMTPSLSLYHGPNNVENFEVFSMSSLVSELSKHAPELYEVFQTLGQTARLKDDRDQTDESYDVMAVMSLCTLLKCRSQKVLGIQLLITLMLLARSTNKQV